MWREQGGDDVKMTTWVSVLDDILLRALELCLEKLLAFLGSITGNHCIICSIVIVYYSGICIHSFYSDATRHEVWPKHVFVTLRSFNSNVVSSLFNTQAQWALHSSLLPKELLVRRRLSISHLRPQSEEEYHHHLRLTFGQNTRQRISSLGPSRLMPLLPVRSKMYWKWRRLIKKVCMSFSEGSVN